MPISFSVVAACLNAAAEEHWHPPGTNSPLKLGQRRGNLGVAKCSGGVFWADFFFFFPGKLCLPLLQGPA